MYDRTNLEQTFLNYIIVIKFFYFRSYMTSVQAYIKERKKKKERSVKLFMRPNCVMIVYGVEYFKVCAFSLPHDGESNAREPERFSPFVSRWMNRDRTKSSTFYLSLLQVRTWSRLLLPCSIVLL